MFISSGQRGTSRSTLVWLIYLIFCLYAILADFSLSKIFLNADAYGYIYPAFEFNYSGELKLIYARPFFWPALLSTLNINNFEATAVLINAILYAALGVPFALLTIHFLKTDERLPRSLLNISLYTGTLFLLFSNVNVKQW